MTRGFKNDLRGIKKERSENRVDLSLQFLVKKGRVMILFTKATDICFNIWYKNI